MISTMQSYTATATPTDYFDFATVAELEQQLFALPSSDFDVSKKRQAEDDLMILDDLLVGYGQQQCSGYESFDALFGAPDPLAFSGHFDFKEEPRIPSGHLAAAFEIPRSPSTVSTASSSSCYSSSPESRVAVTVPTSRSMPLDPAARRRERNRLAAERCRQRKTGLIESLQKECDDLRRQKEQLLKENERLLRALGLKF